MGQKDGQAAESLGEGAEDTAPAASAGRSPRRRAGLVDVAERAGVSHQTVSRVLNNRPNVSGATRQRVRRAMEELDYRPNSAARALVLGRTQVLGVVTMDTTLYGPTETLFGIERAARDIGYHVSITSVRSPNRESVCDALERMRAQAVDGIVVIAPVLAAAEALAHLPSELPLVAITSDRSGPVASVAVDQTSGAARATRYLLDLGHRTVWHISGPRDWLDARDRCTGWRSELIAASAPVPEPIAGDWTAESGYRIGHELAKIPDATAIFAANDQMALGLLRALHEAGRSVPSDVSVVGFDDVPESPYFTPPLTTMRQDFTRLGQRAVSFLSEMITGDDRRSGQQIVLEPDLIVRRSSARPR